MAGNIITAALVSISACIWYNFCFSCNQLSSFRTPLPPPPPYRKKEAYGEMSHSFRRAFCIFRFFILTASFSSLQWEGKHKIRPFLQMQCSHRHTWIERGGVVMSCKCTFGRYAILAPLKQLWPDFRKHPPTVRHHRSCSHSYPSALQCIESGNVKKLLLHRIPYVLIWMFMRSSEQMWITPSWKMNLPRGVGRSGMANIQDQATLDLYCGFTDVVPSGGFFFSRRWWKNV